MNKILHLVFVFKNWGGCQTADYYNRFSNFIVQISHFLDFLSTPLNRTISLSNSIDYSNLSNCAYQKLTLNFYHHSPKEWVSVPMPPFLKY